MSDDLWAEMTAFEEGAAPKRLGRPLKVSGHKDRLQQDLCAKELLRIQAAGERYLNGKLVSSKIVAA